MKNKLLVAITVCLLLLISSCIAGNEVEVHPGEEFSLKSGQIAVISGENLKIEFVEVTEDSRCPKGVTCIWAGRVVAKVKISMDGDTDELLLTQHGLSEEYATVDYREYRLAYHVEPYPQAGQVISKNQYRLLIVVSK